MRSCRREADQEDAIPCSTDAFGRSICCTQVMDLLIESSGAEQDPAEPDSSSDQHEHLLTACSTEYTLQRVRDLLNSSEHSVETEDLPSGVAPPVSPREGILRCHSHPGAIFMQQLEQPPT